MEKKNNLKDKLQIQGYELDDRSMGQMLGLSLVIVRNHEGKFLAVKETDDRGWWIPGGKVDPPEDFFVASRRECIEEAGIDIVLKGILHLNFM